MLVLSRKLKQEIVIGDNVKVTVLKIKGNTVRLGIEAPREIHVLRGELPQLSEFEAASEPQTETAEFTVVFNNDNEANTAQLDVIPFQEQEKKSSKASNARESESAKSVHFRGQLPAPLQHNRLKEIVSRLTTSSRTTNR